MSEKISKPGSETNGVCGTSPLVGSFGPKSAAADADAVAQGIAGDHGLGPLRTDGYRCETVKGRRH
ncbi:MULTISPECIES: hypothetical protein [unclassified Mesorhizobium]|uniref:hypothetical protein n=1 Tax=unclassified Mesorhizobium TaxID=325217 RepID=UPI0012DCDDA7|nr:hypothetical protein [Mesorhizobium sp. L2C066B000]